MNKAIEKITTILKQCSFCPSVVEQQEIDEILMSFPTSERDEIEETIQLVFIMAKANN